MKYRSPIPRYPLLIISVSYSRAEYVPHTHRVSRRTTATREGGFATFPLATEDAMPPDHLCEFVYMNVGAVPVKEVLPKDQIDGTNYG